MAKNTGEMMTFVIVLSALIASSVRAGPGPLRPDLRLASIPESEGVTVSLGQRFPIPRAGEGGGGETEETLGTGEKTFKMDKKGFAYLMAGLVLKALAFIKMALVKLTILANVSIIVSKLSLLLPLLLAFGKYFGGIGKMLKLKAIGYDGQHYGYYSGLQNRGNYLT